MGSHVCNSSTIIIYNSEEPLIGKADTCPRLGGMVLGWTTSHGAVT